MVSGFCILVFWLTQRSGEVETPTPLTSDWITQAADKQVVHPSDPLPCRNLPGAEDVLVVLKTGSTELEDKLPIHLNTTLRCYPNYVIFSDWAETYEGIEILDALEFVSPELKESHQDFGLYRRLQKHGGRAAIKPSERSGPISRPQGAMGKPTNEGWKLDKWKFLPMVNRTLHEYPGMKWYVFIEVDTYVFWQTLLNYLKVLDWTEPYYIGGQIYIGDILFAHGGTGFAVSRPALEMVVSMIATDQKGWEDFTNSQWAGDCVLGKAMKDAGAPLTPAWPIWQNDDIGFMNYARDDTANRLWCRPTVSYHHLSPTAIEDMWLFEQEWIERTRGDASKYLRHKDVYREYILPRVQQSRWDWDNHCDVDQGPVHSLNKCRAICEAIDACVQYQLDIELRCRTTSMPNMGEWSRGVDSGWIYERMQKFYDEQKSCHGEEWIT